MDSIPTEAQKTPTILSGKAVAEQLKQELKAQIAAKQTAAQAEGKSIRNPKLVIVMLGDDPASAVYVNNKLKLASSVNIDAELLHFPSDMTELALLNLLQELNADTSVDGILVQLPLPQHIDVRKVQSCIAVDKDVDGFAKEHMGACWLGLPAYKPCTAAGIMRILAYYGINLAGLNCLIIGRSNIVAKPLAAFFLAADATVTIAHSKTKDLAKLVRTMDLIVVSVGKADFLQPEMLKDDVILVDVGINRNAAGKIVGDISKEAYTRAQAYTPVPGGVGLLTVAELMYNSYQAWLQHIENDTNN